MLMVPPSRWWEHPRIRGEHTRCPRMMAAIKGSPPHTRGAPISQHHSGIGAGATPAYVGSTTSCCPTAPRSRDHPRVCGEHYDGEDVLILDEGSPRVCGEHGVSGGFHFNAIGSSPPMRGARFARVTSAKWLGIIPAYAGSTFSASTIVAELWDHPRVCGEHNRPHPRSTLITGSSPHMRGAPGSIDVIL